MASVFPWFPRQGKVHRARRVKQDAECLFGGGLCVGAIVAFAESRMAYFAFVPLFSSNEPIFDKLITPTFLARQHHTTSMKNRLTKQCITKSIIESTLSKKESGIGPGDTQPGNARPYHLWVRITKYKCKWCCPWFFGAYFALQGVSYFQCTNASGDNGGMWLSIAGQDETQKQIDACVKAAVSANPVEGNAAKEQKASV